MPEGTDNAFGPGPLAAGAQHFSVAPATSATPLEISGARCEQRSMLGTGSDSGSGMEPAAAAEEQPAGSLHASDKHGTPQALASPEGSAMEVCSSSPRRRGRRGGRRSLSPGEEHSSEACGAPGQQQPHRISLTPLLGRSIEKLRRSWGSAGSGHPKEAGAPREGPAAKGGSSSSSSIAGDLDMQPLWRGHAENLCPNSSAAQQQGRAVIGPPQRSPLCDLHLHQGGAAAVAAWGAQRLAQHVQQQHRLARAGGQAGYAWSAGGTVPGDTAAAASQLPHAAELGTLAQLQAVMQMPALAACAEGGALCSSTVQLVGCIPSSIPFAPYIPACWRLALFVSACLRCQSPGTAFAVAEYRAWPNPRFLQICRHVGIWDWTRRVVPKRGFCASVTSSSGGAGGGGPLHEARRNSAVAGGRGRQQH
jgi:hypothetical protein